jgi:predicted secreted hydrolase
MSRGKPRWLTVAGFLLLLAGVAALALTHTQAATPKDPSALLIPSNNANFKRAESGIQLSFPRDHGAHNDYQTEWWYYTGNLVAEDGRRFGYQLTFFRRALVSPENQAPRDSAWSIGQVYMAHFALSDVSTQQFYFFERFSRSAVGLAGALGEPFYKVWLEDWSVEQIGPSQYRLNARQDGIRIILEMEDVKPIVLQGKDGYSQKGEETGNASYYYSQTRLRTNGMVTSAGQTFAVSGLSWMDHEFSTNALAADEIGWDWYALQLDDGSELMAYPIRKVDGSISPYSQGNLIASDGSSLPLRQDDLHITVERTWRSPYNNTVYPAAWTISVPSEDLILYVEPYIADQELRLNFTYWEGAVRVWGTLAGKPVSGSGYVEMTGYAHSMNGKF